MVRTPQPTRRAILAAGPALLLSSGARAASPQTPMRCADFLDTIGVNTHVGYEQSQYGDLAAIRAALDYLGVRHVRDAAINRAMPNAGHYRALAAAGVRFCLYWGARRPMNEAIGEIAELEGAYPGAAAALEGPNEIKPDFAYAGALGNLAAQRFMADMRTAAAANPQLRRKPIVALTTYARVAVDCDYANAHPYPKGGAQAASLVRTILERQVGPGGAMPGKPMMFTEFGYHTLVGKPSRPNEWQGVDLERHAVLTLSALFGAAAAGIARTYVYQLLDGFPDGARGPNMENHFGLFALNGAPKPAAASIRRLFALLADAGPGARNFAPSPIGARIVAAGPVSSLALQNSAGRRFLALWNQSPVWNAEAAAPQAVDPIPATVTLAAPAPLKAYDLIDPDRTMDLGAGASARIPVGGRPMLLSVG